MSSDASAIVPVPVPNTAVPLGLSDPVEKARAELKAALAAIEEKANVSRRVSRTVDVSIERVRAFSKENPALAATGVLAAAAAVGALVWGIVRLYAR